MRVLVLGANGMLGHKLVQILQTRYQVWGTVRSSLVNYAKFDVLDQSCLLPNVDGANFDSIVNAFAHVGPDCVINCIGIVKQRKEATDLLASISINALFPHRLALLCQACHIRLIHISTDCVFSGRKGMYTEDDISDAEDIYGRTKFLGEVREPGCLTLRTSIIGRELERANGLVEWFLSQRGQKVRGYTHAIFSGFTTHVLSNIIGEIIEKQLQLTGVYHVSAEPISKYDLLCLLREAYSISIDIEPYPDVRIDRSLNSDRFRSLSCFVPPSWADMVKEMSIDSTPYGRW